MGTYATTASLSNLLPGSLKCETTTTDDRGRAMFSAHIDRAESIVNGYISSRYSLPFTNVPPILRTLTEDIACYYFLRNSLTFDPKEKNPYLEEYKMAMGTLKSIQIGETNLILTDGSQAGTSISGRILSSTENYTPVFGLDNEERWKRDDDEIADQEAKRL